MTDICFLSSILEDCKRAGIGDAKSLDLDLIRVTRLYETRGLPILMIDFPDACKVLDASLSRSYLNPQLLPNSFGKRTLSSDKWLFGTLFLKLFNESGTLVEDPDINVIFFLRQILLLYKKVHRPCPPENVDKAVREFFRIENDMRPPSNPWNLDSVDWNLGVSFIDGYRSHDDMVSYRDLVPRKVLTLLETVFDRIVTQLPILNPRDVVPRHGPGAVCDTKGDKYTFPYYPEKLSNYFEEDYFSSPNSWCFLLDNISRSQDEPPARLIAVPKTLKGPRLIASEPTSHQFLQQGLLLWFRKNLPKPIRLSFNPFSQDPSRVTVLKASLTGEISSIDLSSASDRLSCWVIERAFRRNPSVLDGLHAVRTRMVKDFSSSTPGECILLKKYANQGSAVTFILQSIIYAVCCITSLLFEEGKQPTIENIEQCAKRIRVFGDDLLIPKLASPTLSLLLDHLGLKVNMSKTHVEGHFRESCGMDAFAGHDVSPVYISNLQIKDTYESLSSWIEVCNNAYRKGLWTLADYMYSQVPTSNIDYIPISHWPHSGGPVLYTFQKLTRIKSEGRWNNALQRCDVKLVMSKVSAEKGDRVGSQGVYQYFIDRPEPESNWSQGHLARPRIRRRIRWVAS